MKGKKNMDGIQTRNNTKLSPLSDDVMVYIKYLKKYTKVSLKYCLSLKITRYHMNIKKTVVLCKSNEHN